jgi:hypothetical protein
MLIRTGALLAVFAVVTAAAGFRAAGAQAAPAPVQRTLVWSLGDHWEMSPADAGQGRDVPVFARTRPTCVREGNTQLCSGGTGPVSFHIERPSLRRPPPEYRNMIVLSKWDAAKQYAFVYELVPGAIYDVQFQTVNRMPDDAKDVQCLLWQVHPGRGNVITGFGMDNPDGRGNQFFFNYHGHEGGPDPFPWHGATKRGDTDTWEIEFRNAADASGWIELYRNGKQQFFYEGPVVPTTYLELMSFGIYYYHWHDIDRSTILSTDVTFNYFNLWMLAKRVPPFGAIASRNRGR